MAKQVCAGAQLTCTFGAAPSVFSVLPTNMTNGGGPPAANIMDNIPMTNIPPFGMCLSPSNPTVAAATAAAFGVLTPMPCVPVIPAPWSPGASTVNVGSMPALNDSSTCSCAYGGVIQVSSPGQTSIDVP